MINIVVPMAGAGSRFAKVGYREPKPLIPVHGVPMIRVVIENLRPRQAHKFIFICQEAHAQAYGLQTKLSAWAPNSEMILIDGVTDGAACTVLKARNLIDNEDTLMIANSDQYIDADINDYLASMEHGNKDGLIMTMKADDPKWSFVGFDQNGAVNRVVEKQVISDEATVGIYNFKRGRDFVAAAEGMIKANERVNGEFYVAPTYNQMISAGKRIGIHNIGAVGNCMYGLGTPDDLNQFLALPLSQRLQEKRT